MSVTLPLARMTLPGESPEMCALSDRPGPIPRDSTARKARAGSAYGFPSTVSTADRMIAGPKPSLSIWME